jgi:hypothetical protein
MTASIRLESAFDFESFMKYSDAALTEDHRFQFAES